MIDDRSTLEEVMPSLTENVKHLNPTNSEQIILNDQYATLSPAEVPANVTVFTLDTIDEINTCCQLLLNDANNSTSNIHIGFDCEWAYQGSIIPLEERLSVKFIDVSLVQIAYKFAILFDTYSSFQSGNIPKKT